MNGGRLAAKRSAEGTVVLDLTFECCQWGLDGLAAVLATLRLARISYVAWDVRECEIAGTGREFQPERGIERYFSVMADGEPILSASDLEEFEGRFGTAEALLESIRGWLRLPTPEDLTDLDVGEHPPSSSPTSRPLPRRPARRSPFRAADARPVVKSNG